jgi:hypothetical protein
LHNEVPGITINPGIFETLHQAGKNAYRAGVDIAVDLIDQMKTWAQGVYLMPAFERYDLAADIVDAFRS